MQAKARIPLREAKRRISAINKALEAGYPRDGTTHSKSALAVAALALGMPRLTLLSSLEPIERHFKLKPDWSREQHKMGTGRITPRVAATEQRQRDRISELQQALKDAHREMAAGNDLRESLFGLAKQRLTPPDWTIETSAPGSPGMPVLFTSDFQWGEVVRPGELDGINAFNVAIAQTRYRLLIERTIDLAFNHMTKPKYPGIIYLRGGDAVSGDIHAELRETNELQAIPAVKSLVESEAWGIERLREKFGRVHVLSVPGNHGRVTMKPQAKLFATTNYDTLSAWMLESYCREDKGISFITPESGDCIFRVFGWTFLLTHGDRIGSRGGEGFIGPAATIARGMKKLTDYYATLGVTIDTILVGHFHEYMELTRGFCNGSLPGYSEYAKTHRMHPAAPKQLLFFVHPKFGVTARWPILLSNHPKRTMAVDDLAKSGPR